MPTHLVSLPGVRAPAFGVSLGSTLNHVSVSAVHGNTTKTAVSASKPTLSAAQTHTAVHGNTTKTAVSASKPTLSAAQTHTAVPTHLVSTPKTY
jgi:hypothetical protein